MRHAVSDRSSEVLHRSFGSNRLAKGSLLSSLARVVVVGGAALAVLSCRSDAPTEPARLATSSEPQLTLTGGTGTLIFPTATPGEFQPTGFAIGLNNSGQVTGAARLLSTDDQNKPYRWTPGQAAVKLLGCCDTQFGVDINDAGVVVGSEQVDAVTGWRGFVATGINMVRLSILPGAPVDGDAQAIAVNDLGDIVGVSVSPGGAGHAVLWSPAGVIQDLGTLGGTRSKAVDINASSHVIGTSTIAGDAATHAFFWSSGTGMQDLNTTIGANITDVVEINDAGQIVGSYVASNGQSHAFLYTPGSGLQDLGTLGGTFSAPTGLNGDGDVVGTSAIADETPHAFLWTASDGMEDITAVTGVTEVRRLNDQLQTLTGTRPPTSLVLQLSTVIPKLVQLEVTSANQAPVASFTYTCAEKGRSHRCTFDASGSTDDVGIVSYRWDWGNGRQETRKHAVTQQVWREPGTYTVTLTVTDTQGATASVAQQVTVP